MNHYIVDIINYCKNEWHSLNLKIKNSSLIFKFFLTILACFFIDGTFAQSVKEKKVYYIQNVQTGLILDVKGGENRSGTKVWQYSLNYTKAQLFSFSSEGIPSGFGENTFRINSYVAGFLRDKDKCLTIKQKPQERVISEPRSSSPIHGHSSPALERSEVLVAETPRKGPNFLKGYILTIEEFKLRAPSPLDAVSPSQLGGNHKRIWEIIPVPNKPNTYFIQNAEFPEKMLLQPKSFNSGADLALALYDGSKMQQWKILPASPNRVVDMKVTNFVWCSSNGNDSEISGTLTWEDNTANKVEEYRVYVKEDIGNFGYFELAKLESNTFSYHFKTSSINSPEDISHRFRVINFTKWGLDNNNSIAVVPNTCTPPSPEEEEPSIISYGSYLEADTLSEDIIIYSEEVNPRIPSKLIKVRVTGNSFTPYLVHFLPLRSSRTACGTDVGAIVNPGNYLTGIQLYTLYGNVNPETPVLLSACKLSRSGEVIPSSEGAKKIRIQVTYKHQ